MLKDITIGQFYPGKSKIHRLDPRAKIILTFIYLITLFIVKNFLGFAVVAALLLIVIKMSGVPVKMVFKSLKPIVIIMIFTGVINVFYTPGTPIFQLGIFHPTFEGLRLAVFMILRIILLVSGSAMLTYTTSPIMLTDGLERLFGPLKAFHLPVHELAMMMTIALRFIPTLIEETEKIMNAQKARGADFESGNVFKRTKALVPVLVPMFISAFRRADDLAVAMECRCYHGDEGRTRMTVLKYRSADVVSIAIMLMVMALIIAANILF